MTVSPFLLILTPRCACIPECCVVFGKFGKGCGFYCIVVSDFLYRLLYFRNLCSFNLDQSTRTRIPKQNDLFTYVMTSRCKTANLKHKIEITALGVLHTMILRVRRRYGRHGRTDYFILATSDYAAAKAVAATCMSDRPRHPHYGSWHCLFAVLVVTLRYHRLAMSPGCIMTISQIPRTAYTHSRQPRSR